MGAGTAGSGPGGGPGAAREVVVRATTRGDGSALFHLVRNAGELEPNTGYAYVLLADMFGDTCALAEVDGRVAGGVIGFRPPRQPSALFVWQIGVDPRMRGQGVAQRMLDHIFERPEGRDLSELLTTVAPSNTASERMFRRFATRRGGTMARIDSYPADLFPEPHEAEHLFHLTGLTPSTDV